MTVDIRCGCGAAYRLAPERAGETFTCKVCKAQMQIPGGVPRAIFRPESVPAPAISAPPVPAPVVLVPVGTAAAVANDSVSQPATQWSSMESFPPREPEPAESLETAPVGFLGGAPVVRLKGFQAGALDTSIRPPIDPAAPGVESRLCPSKAEPERVPQQADGQVDPAAIAPRSIPASWWLVRGVLAAVCIGMFFAPWFTVAFPGKGTEGVQTESISGWSLTYGMMRGLFGSETPSASPRKGTPFSGDLPKGAVTAAAGALMMGGAPFVYIAAMVLVAVFAYVVRRREGRGAVWPFVVFEGAVTLFILGWWLFASCGAVQQMLQFVRQMGVTIGVSVWVYVLWFMLGAFIVIARIRPDFELEHAAQVYADPQA